MKVATLINMLKGSFKANSKQNDFLNQILELVIYKVENKQIE